MEQKSFHMPMSRFCSAAAKERMNHDNLLLYSKSLFTLQVFIIVKVLVGVGCETADRKLRYNLIRESYLGTSKQMDL